MLAFVFVLKGEWQKGLKAMDEAIRVMPKTRHRLYESLRFNASYLHYLLYYYFISLRFNASYLHYLLYYYFFKFDKADSFTNWQPKTWDSSISFGIVLVHPP